MPSAVGVLVCGQRTCPPSCRPAVNPVGTLGRSALTPPPLQEYTASIPVPRWMPPKGVPGVGCWEHLPPSRLEEAFVKALSSPHSPPPAPCLLPSPSVGGGPKSSP